MSLKPREIATDKAPQALGPYSQAVMIQNLVFVSGQIPVVPTTGKFVEGDIQSMTHQALDNLEAILDESGCSLEHVVRVDIFLKDLKDFVAMNEAYGERFNGPVPPARQTVQVVALPLDAPIEISCIAILATKLIV